MYYHFKDKQNVNSQHSKFFQIFCFKEKEENSLMMSSYLAKLKKLLYFVESENINSYKSTTSYLKLNWSNV